MFILVHECLFCSQTFNSASDKDDHTLDHFAQESCMMCEQNLIRIGSDLYVKHNAASCTKMDPNVEQDQYSVKLELETIDLIEQSIAENDILSIESIDKLSNQHMGEPNLSCEHGRRGDHKVDTSEKIKTEFNSNQLDYHIKYETIVYNSSNRNEVETNENRNIHLSDTSNEFNSSEQNSSDRKEMETNETKEKNQSECNICGKVLNIRSVMRHKVLIHNLCIICTKLFSSKSDLNIHSLSCKKPSKDETRTCEICNEILKSDKKYNVHMETMHNPNEPRIINGRYECDLCSKLFTRRPNLKRHKIINHKMLGEIVCNICLKVFSTDDELTFHGIKCIRKKILSKPGNFECDICTTIFASKQTLLLHMKYKHINIERPFQCNLCDFAFYNKRHLDSHRDCVHLNIRNFVCSICGKTFKQKFQLKRHMYGH